ncbi:hypothetical protein [Clostridium tertium]|uniref:hypothetical protein n=1 Tax=Clostridium tertium TaxID=1559 RepID=UPI0024B37DA2|nr:hypothetical protein [Clostridium tertium]MDI9216014.1 hypothetical protein [Clostridium tertium]
MNDNPKIKCEDLFSGCGVLKENLLQLIAITETPKNSTPFADSLSLLLGLYHEDGFLKNIKESKDPVAPIDYYKNCTFKKCNIVIINGNNNKVYEKPETKSFFSKVKAIFAFARKLFSSSSESDDNYSKLILT